MHPARSVAVSGDGHPSLPAVRHRVAGQPPEPSRHALRLRGMNAPHHTRRLGVGILSLSLLLVACSTAGAPPASSPPVDTSPDTSISAPPTDGSGGVTDPGGVGGGGKLVVPRPGQLDVHDVRADELAARVDGATIMVTVTWTSGVEPCSVLDQVVVAQSQNTYAITLREGHGPEDVACIAIAEIHKTEFAIPTDGPGTYTIVDATGGAAPIEVTVG